MKWLPMNREHFEIDTPGMSRPAAWATMAALILAEFVIIVLIIRVLLGADIAFPAG